MNNYQYGLSDVDRFNTFLQRRDVFSFTRFGEPSERGPEGPLTHLKEEIQELLDDLDDPLEWADCFLLLLDAARRRGLSIDDLMKFAEAKLVINQARTWVKHEDGTYKHQK